MHRSRWLGRVRAHIKQFHDENRSETGGPSPRGRFEPGSFHLRCMLANVEHHDHEQEQHHNCSRVDNQLEGGEEWRPDDVKINRDAQQGNNEVEQRMHGVISRDRNYRGKDCYRGRYVKGNQHNLS